MLNDRFDNELEDVVKAYPTLIIVQIQEERILKGEIEIIDTAQKVWDKYHIEIHPTEKYPLLFPKVFETGNKIPKIADWHINQNDYSCCIDVETSQFIKCNNGINMMHFIEKEVIPYFANQTHRIKEGYYLNGEYAHGLLGHIQFYMQKLQAPNFFKCIEWLQNMYNGLQPIRTSICYCGTNEKYRKCHKKIYDEINCIDKSLIAYHLQQFINIYKTPTHFYYIKTTLGIE